MTESAHVRAERQYFSLRYAIPGYTFILIVVIINYVPLLAILKTRGFEPVFGAFLAFLSLLSGSAIGFLVSQFWWCRFQKNRSIFGVERFREITIEAFTNRYETIRAHTDNERRMIIAACDYVSHSKTRKNLLDLSERRWDMYHLLSTTRDTLWIAFTVGVLCRILYGVQTLLQNGFGKDYFSVLFELLALAFIFVGLIFLTFSLKKGIEAIIDEYAYLAAARIRTSKVRRHELERAFPDLFPPE